MGFSAQCPKYRSAKCGLLLAQEGYDCNLSLTIAQLFSVRLSRVWALEIAMNDPQFQLRKIVVGIF